MMEYMFEREGPYKPKDFQTPPSVAKYMVSLIPKDVKTVLEPTPGEGNIVKELKDKYEVIAPDDFFLWEPYSVDAVVMNPPFSSKYANMTNAPKGWETRLKGMKLAYHILVQCMEVSNHVIALMPWFTISDSDVRMRYLLQYGIKSITVLPRRTFNYARIQTCIIELYKGWYSSIDFRYFSEKQLLLL